MVVNRIGITHINIYFAGDYLPIIAFAKFGPATVGKITQKNTEKCVIVFVNIVRIEPGQVFLDLSYIGEPESVALERQDAGGLMGRQYIQKVLQILDCTRVRFAECCGKRFITAG